MEKVKLYRLKLSARERKQLETSLLKTSKVYKWLREEGISKNMIVKKLGIRFVNIYQTFRYPAEYITIGRLLAIADLLPDRTVFEIMEGLIPDVDRKWYELNSFETDILKERFKVKKG